MKNFIILFASLFLFIGVYGQSDGCTSATTLSVAPTCSSPISGTTIGATQTFTGCAGNADDDVWYQFVATSTSHQINVIPSASMDAVVQLFSGVCSSLTSIVCRDEGLSGDQETITSYGLTIGATYRIRVYHYGTGSGSGTFTICLTNPPPAPSNDNCAGATSLLVNTTCTATLGNSGGATQSIAGCAGNADDDIWFSFTATNNVQTVTVAPVSGSLDLVLQVYSGTCGGLVSVTCVDATFTGGNEVANLVGLIVGQVYYVRAHDYYAGTTGTFNICVVGTASSVPTNDNPCSAIALPVVTTTCSYLQFSNVNATSTGAGLAPTPSSCAGGSGAMIGGFSASSKDVWFKMTVPASGKLYIQSKPNIGAGAITDGVMALYSATSCSALTQIACSDDFAAYPGTVHDNLPLISATGLTPGATVYLRYWGFGSAQGLFGFCVTTANNDNCANALYICDINGYSAATSGAYTPDRPSNMFGNNETSAGVNLANGTNSGGVFGYYPYPGVTPGPFSSPFLDVNIENNSWIKFTASSTTATLNVSVLNCWVGNYPSGGIQMQIFSGTNCTNFVPVSNFAENSTGFSVTANGLTVGNDYYLMIDGYAGDICSYTISAGSGVSFPNIPPPAPLCYGQSVVLTAPPGATAYNWQHNGATTQSVTVTPGTTQTYTCVVTGLCDYNQTLDVLVTVKPLPVVAINGGAPISICKGQTVNLTATGGSTYLWNTAATTAGISVAPTSSTTYSVVGTLNGCTASASAMVNVNNNPIITTAAVSNSADCGTANGSITNVSATGAPTLSYAWTNSSNANVGNTANLSSVVAGNYTLVVTDGNGCTSAMAYNIGNLNFSNPTFTVSNLTPCIGSSITLTASHPNPAATFVWSGPGVTGGNQSNNPLTLTTSTSGTSAYQVVASIPGCNAASIWQNVTVNPLPNISITAAGNDSTICDGGIANLTGNGGINYTWTGPNGYTSTNISAVITPFTALNNGYYVAYGTDSNGCTDKDSILVTALSLPVIDAIANNANGVYCSGSTATLSATGASSYVWSGPNNFTSTSASPSVFSLSTAVTGWYYVVGLDANNCSAGDSILINLAQNMNAVAASSDSVICPGEDVLFTASGGNSYIWSGPAGLNTQQPTFTVYAVTPTNTGWYHLTSLDTNGCVAGDSTYLSVEPDASCLLIPNLFTPDFDYHNDTWVIIGLENFKNAEVEVYNRWGNIVYKVSPYNNDWDGTVNEGATIGSSGKVPIGTYFYIIRLNDDENTPAFKGYVEIQY